MIFLYCFQLYFLIIINLYAVDSSISLSRKVCRGTSEGLTHSNLETNRYEEMVKMYSNCTLIDGNLEITFLKIPHVDLSFLSSIQEITGYLLILNVWADVVPLTSLHIVRGRQFFYKNYSVFIAYNFQYSSNTSVGLKELQFKSLREIQAGSVLIMDNNHLCHVNHVNWRDILSYNNTIEYIPFDANYTHSQCGVCHSSCESNYCWGEGPDMCQKLIKVICSAVCDGQCYGPSPNQCCHKNCAGGCSGSSKSNCWACRDFDNNGTCEASCSDIHVYVSGKSTPSYTHKKYSYGTLCVDKCPEFMNKYNMACVKDCGIQRKIDNEVDRNCVPCNGPCPKNCRLPTDRFINSGNIGLYQGCTIVQGNIVLLDSSFEADAYYNLSALSVDKLSILESIQEVTGHVIIQVSKIPLRNLNFLRNLRIIHGQTLDRQRLALQIFKTSLDSLGLDSLRQIKNGHVFISNNSRLCYASNVNWSSMFTSVDQKTVVEHNRNHNQCVLDNEICNQECTGAGCMGPGEDQCLSCVHYTLHRYCLAACNASLGHFEISRNTCEYCHPECEGGCTSANENACTKCKNYKNGDDCVGKCPLNKYPDANGICQFCHLNCDPSDGCTGPFGYAGQGGCKSCALAIESSYKDNALCVNYPFLNCPTDHFRIRSKPNVCGKCDDQCLECYGYGADSCYQCRNFNQDNVCVEKCDSDRFTKPENRTCLKCDDACLQCDGSTEADCLVCKNKKVYSSSIDDWLHPPTDATFYCADLCPASFPNSKVIHQEIVCAPMNLGNKNIIIAVVVCMSFLVILTTIAILALCWRKQNKMKKEYEDRVKADQEILESMINKSEIKPDKSKLELINYSELTIYEVIGMGAYGVVHKGIWNPKKKKVPTATLR